MNRFRIIMMLVIGIFLIFSLEGCKTRCNSEALFLQTVGLSKDDDINQTMRIDYLNGQKVVLRKGEYQQFDTPIHDLKRPIRFIVGETDFFYVFDEDTCQWNSVKNDITHFGDDAIVEPEPGFKILWFGSVMFIDPAAITEPTKVRVLVKGYFLDDNGNNAEPVAAFMDVIIEP